jgi:hypothetical protein
MPRWDPCHSPSACDRYRLSDDGSPHLGYWEAPTSLAGKRPVRAARNRSPAMLTSLSRESGVRQSWIGSSDTAAQVRSHSVGPAAGGLADRNQSLTWWAILGSNQ